MAGIIYGYPNILIQSPRITYFCSVKSIIIAIDGFSSCGKSTLAKALASALNYAYVDSGAMYRAVTLYFQEVEVDLHEPEAVVDALNKINISFKFNKEKGRNETYLNGRMVEDMIRSQRVSEGVSPVATIKKVREEMVRLQREAGRDKAIVMDGRDIGTNVFPDAELKIFMTASADVRAQRRYAELLVKGETWSLDAIKQNLMERDHIDSTRSENPLRQAADARILDNSTITEKEQLGIALKWAHEAIETA